MAVQEQSVQTYAKNQGEEYIYQEKQSGGKVDWEESSHALKASQPGNKFVVYKLDWLATPTKNFIIFPMNCRKKGAEFISILDNIDTTTSTARAMFRNVGHFCRI